MTESQLPASRLVDTDGEISRLADRESSAQESYLRAVDNDDDEGITDENETCIAFIGMTGSGKSSLIASLAETPVVKSKALSYLGTETTWTERSMFKYGERKVHLIDTPSFDDKSKVPAEVLGDISGYLATQHSRGLKLAGLVYVYDAAQPRPYRMEDFISKIYAKLIGNDAEMMPSIVMATNMWDVLRDEHRHDAAEQQRNFANSQPFLEATAFLKTPIFELSGEVGSQDRRSSAVKIIETLVDLANPIILNIQKQLVDEGKKLAQTDAGKEMQTNVTKLKDKLDQKLARTEADRLKALEEQNHNRAILLSSRKAYLEYRMRSTNETLKYLECTLEELNDHNAALRAKERTVSKNLEESLAKLEEMDNCINEKSLVISDVEKEYHDLEANAPKPLERYSRIGRQLQNIENKLQELKSSRKSMSEYAHTQAWRLGENLHVQSFYRAHKEDGSVGGIDDGRSVLPARVEKIIRTIFGDPEPSTNAAP